MAITTFLDYNNILWGCGCNDHGQLGIGHLNCTKNMLPTYNENIAKTKIIIKQMVSGHHHNLLLDDKGMCFLLFNYYGQCGVGDSTPASTYILSPTLTSNRMEMLSLI